jgi:hypothetical protein
MAIQIDVKCSLHRENHDDDRSSLIDETLAEIIPAKLLESGLVERGWGDTMRRLKKIVSCMRRGICMSLASNGSFRLWRIDERLYKTASSSRRASVLHLFTTTSSMP